MKRKDIYIGTGAFLVLALLAIGAFGFRAPTSVPQESGINYAGTTCWNIVRADGTVEPLGCNKNVLTNAGKNAIENALANGTVTKWNYIAVGNGSTPTVDSTTLANEITGDCNMARAASTYSHTSDGNWTYEHQFVNNCTSELVNSSAMFNDATAGTMLCGNSFTSATLQPDDTLTVTWYIWVDEP